MLASILVIVFVAQFAFAFAMSPYIEWSVIGQFITNGAVLAGLFVTLELTIIAMSLSLVIAIVIAVMGMSPSIVIRSMSNAYVFIFRGVPLLVILILAGNLGLFYKNITIGIPFTDIIFYSLPTQTAITPFVASVIGLTLSASAYMSEIVRGGLLAVNRDNTRRQKLLGLITGRHCSTSCCPKHFALSPRR